MDITTAFEAVIPGSNPGGSTASLRVGSRGAELLQLRQDSKDFSLTIPRVRKVPADVIGESWREHKSV